MYTEVYVEIGILAAKHSKSARGTQILIVYGIKKALPQFQ